MIWREAVIEALQRYSIRNKTYHIERQRLIDEEMDSIVHTTITQGKTPSQTLSRVLQELRGDVLAFVSEGHYVLLDAPLDISNPAEIITEETIEDAILANKILLPTIETGDTFRYQRVRLGQQKLREQTLKNYGNHCALCDIQQQGFLIASHIIGWAERTDIRGDLRNVICLCRFHDPLFEQGYLSLSDDFEIHKKAQPHSKMLAQVLDATIAFTLPTHYAPYTEYLAHHRNRSGF